MPQTETGRLRRDGLPELAYEKRPGEGPTILFLPGFMSDMAGTKATALDAHCREEGYGFLRFDYRGHGRSAGRFTEGDITYWTHDVLTMIDELTHGPLLLIGSSMGGWLMLLAALERRERVSGLIGIAAAPDFTEDLMWARYSDEARRQIMEEGIYHEPSDYGAPLPVTRNLIEDGRRHLLLRAPIALSCPVRLLHGMEDREVPYETALKLVRCLASTDVEVTLVKSGDHRLSTPSDLDRLFRTVDTLVG
jgi:pimeloyl-ACP methyl ester carboxylesterase